MIRRLHVENLRCLRNVALTLEPLTVLAGANASGKSSVLVALQGSWSTNDRRARDESAAIAVEVERDDASVARRILEPGAAEPRQVSGNPPDCQLLHLDLKLMRQPNQVAELQKLESSGYGLTNLFASLTRRLQDDIALEFGRLLPMFLDVAARPLNAGNHRLVFQDRWQPDVWYEPREASDGALVLLAFLLLRHQSPAPELICIEEPERGLHPSLLGQLMPMLRRLTSGPGSKPIQVVLATQSAELLAAAHAREVRFLSRSQENGEVRVGEASSDHADWPRTLRECEEPTRGRRSAVAQGGIPAG